MQVKVNDLLKHFDHEPESFKDLLQLIQGSPEQPIEKVLPPDQADAKTLSFCSETTHYEAAARTKPAVLVVLQKTWDAHKANVLAQYPQATILLTRNLPLAMAHTLSYFDEKDLRFPTGQQKNCSVSPSAQVSPLARLGAYCVIGDDCVIAEHVFIGPHCIIERGSKIGEGTKLHGHVFVGAGTHIGKNCEIHSHTTLGSDGFGYATDSKFKNHKIPQLGRVVIEDHVEIGANCSIDRATLTETRIKSGTKIDNLCHIAHNCEIGSDSLIAAGFMTAGSTKIGARFMTGGNSVVSSHLEITDGVMLAGRSTVTNDISEPGAYGGYPLQPLKEALKTISSLSALPELRKQMNKVLKHLGLNQP